LSSCKGRQASAARRWGGGTSDNGVRERRLRPLWWSAARSALRKPLEYQDLRRSPEFHGPQGPASLT
jgi:hypothetical protein